MVLTRPLAGIDGSLGGVQKRPTHSGLSVLPPYPQGVLPTDHQWVLPTTPLWVYRLTPYGYYHQAP